MIAATASSVLVNKPTSIIIVYLPGCFLLPIFSMFEKNKEVRLEFTENVLKN
jgi:hypothetical protein